MTTSSHISSLYVASCVVLLIQFVQLCVASNAVNLTNRVTRDFHHVLKIKIVFSELENFMSMTNPHPETANIALFLSYF